MGTDDGGPIVVWSYPGRTQADAAAAFGAHATEMATKGYEPISQSWSEGRPGVGRVLAIGLLANSIRPNGYLTVTYRRTGPPPMAWATSKVDPRLTQGRTAAIAADAPTGEDGRVMKRCPDCAEDVRAEARICRFCRYEFPPQPEPVVALAEETAAGRREPVDLGRWRLENAVMGFGPRDTVQISITEMGGLSITSRGYKLGLDRKRVDVSVTADGAALRIADGLRKIVASPLDDQHPPAVMAEITGA